jgi:LDH2 family malate/lactate/ureidoglycolate dehydrogenase
MAGDQDATARVRVPAEQAAGLAARILAAAGLAPATAREVAEHLADANLCGVDSHGLVRVMQYVRQLEGGYMRAGATPVLEDAGRGARQVDGRGGIGIPAMRLAVDAACADAEAAGIAQVAVRHVGHTGRLGAHAERAAERGRLVILLGGGNRHNWRQVAPYGGRKGMLPTNPYCIGFPGGDRGPVVIDFATSAIAGGWIYAARSAGTQLPEGAVIDPEGRPTRDPEDYFRGGAIRPAGGAKGYALGLMAELICEAMLGPVERELHWLAIAIDPGRWREPLALQAAAEEILAELRACPPAEGFERVEIPGERERARRAAAAGTLALPERTWAELRDLGARMGV